MTTLLYRMGSQFFNIYSTIFGDFQNQITVHILPKRELWTHIVVKQQPTDKETDESWDIFIIGKINSGLV